MLHVQLPIGLAKAAFFFLILLIDFNSKKTLPLLITILVLLPSLVFVLLLVAIGKNLSECYAKHFSCVTFYQVGIIIVTILQRRRRKQAQRG